VSFPPTGHGLSSLPLASLPAIVLDTETTGLDVGGDRVVEIGAIRLGGPEGAPEDTFAMLVQPGIAIPPSASRIHGIHDADVIDAPRFADAMAALIKWAGPSLVIGFSIGFDLAILKAEHERNGLTWRAPRSLDVRYFLQILAPALPEQSLDMTAEWLTLPVADRHRALGDARLTAQAFQALVPMLRKRQITNLAQLERALRADTARRDEEARAGWHGAETTDMGSAGIAEYARIDSFPYRHRVGDLMRSPALIVANDTTLEAALGTMVKEEVSSLFVFPPDDSTGPDNSIGNGIVTERDVMRALEGHGAGALQQPVANFAQRPLVTVEADEFAYRALGRMAKGGFRHLGVVDDKGALAGALSARDLLRQRADDAVSLGEGIASAANAAELGRVWSELTSVARALVYEEVDARDTAAIISRELRALTSRACELAELDLKAAGEGAAPVPYAMLVLGSGGRGESLLAMDQDNAIVYAEAGTDGTVDQWFRKLGQRAADILDQVGVEHCKGGVMAANDAWRADMAGWRSTIGGWISRSQPKDILNCDIFFDAAPVHGEAALARTLLAEARQAAAGAPGFLRALALNAASFESPMGWFGRLKKDNGRVDLKAGGIMPIFSTARVLALTHGLTARSTPARLQAAGELGVATTRTIDNLIEAHRILLGLILQQQLSDIDQGLALSNKVAVSDLTGLAAKELSWALNQLPSLADLLGVPVSR
jgi:CBS domain-containing protein